MKPRNRKRKPKAKVVEEKLLGWALAFWLLLMLALGWQLWGVARLKAGQHVAVTSLAPIVPQGREPGKVENPLALEAGPGGSVLALHRVEFPQPKPPQPARRPYYWIQRLDRTLKLETWRSFDKIGAPSLEGVVDLAVDFSGTAHLAFSNGRVVRFDSGFAFRGEMRLPLQELTALEISDDGRFYALQALARKVSCFDRQGRLLAETPKRKLVAPKRLALTGSGRVAVLDESKQGYDIKLFSPELKFERSTGIANLKPSPVVRLAAAGQEILVINDAHGIRGALFYRADKGEFVGQTLGIMDQAPLIHPGFVGADRWNGDIYFHFGPGLLKCRLPKAIYGETALLGGEN